MPDISANARVLAALRDCLPGLPAAPAALNGSLPPLRRRTLAAGQTLFAQGQRTPAFYLLEHGRLALQIGHHEGAASLLNELTGPALLGLAAFVTARPSSFEARATSPSTVWAIGDAPYALLMDHWPGFARALMRRFAEHFDGNLRLLGAARHAPASERLEQTLDTLVQEQAAPVDAQGWCRLAVTQSVLAQRAGVSRQGTNAWLRAQQREGRVELGYGWLSWAGSAATSAAT